MKLFNKSSALPFVVALLAAEAVNGQDAGFLAALKMESGFISWPGQSGPVQGFKFQLAQYPALSGFSIARDTLNVNYLTYGVVRHLTLSNGAGSLMLTIGVGAGSVSNGHTLFLVSDATNRDLDYFSAFSRGDLLTVNPVGAGDLNFVGPGADSTNLIGYLAFLRNNVFLILDDSPNTPSGVNFGVLTAELDAAIQAQAVSPLAYAAPVVTTFSPTSTTLSASVSPTTTASIVLTDPTGASGPLSRQFLDGGNLTVVDSGGPRVSISATSTTGSLPLVLIALNAYLQFSTSTVTFLVNP